MKISFLISPSWIQPTSDGAGCKRLAGYPANISTTKARHPGSFLMRSPFSSIPTGSSRTGDETGSRPDPHRSLALDWLL